MRKREKRAEIDYNPRHSAHGYEHVRWIEHATRGLRLVGFADEISRGEGSRAIDHKGWYTHDDGDPPDTYRGIVYQLPARGGKAQFAYGYADPDNDGCALLCFDLDADDKMEAARYADRMAEIYAESERDYNRAWDAGRRYEDLGEDVKDLRSHALALGAEMRAARRAGVAYDVTEICSALREKLLGLYRRIQRARKERAELLDNFGSQKGFADA